MATAKLENESFDAELFEARLEALKDTQEGIQQMSQWCLSQRANHKKIVTSWLNVLKRVSVDHRLVLFYLANDVIQYSKRKRYEFVDSWATALQRATTMVRDEKVKGKVLRIFKIWEQREIYNEEYLGDLCGLLNINPPKKTAALDSDDFQNSLLITSIKECVNLSNLTDKSFNKMPKQTHLDDDNANIIQQLKERHSADEVVKEVERYLTYCEAFNKNLQAEIKGRKEVLNQLDTAIKFYSHQRGEVKVVANAYKHFGARIKTVKKKLDEMIPSLPSPIPSPDINAPSPERDADLQLPDEQPPISLNLFKTNNGYASYMDSGKLPFDISDFNNDSSGKTSSQPIEVIASRSDDESYNSGGEYYKPESISAYTNSSSIEIPGLGAIPVPAVQSEYTSLARAAEQYSKVLPHAAAASHYGTSNYAPHINTYMAGQSSYNAGSLLPPPPPQMPSVANASGLLNDSQSSDRSFNSTWDMNMSWTGRSMDTSAVGVPGSAVGADTPHSPPHYERQGHDANAIEYSEVHNSSMLGAQDVDHRLPPAFDCVKPSLVKEKVRLQDVDHRNLISLTGSPRANEKSNQSASSWLSAHTEPSSGDVDYRQAIKTIDTSGNVEIPLLSAGGTPPLSTMGPPSAKKASPRKSSNSSTSESQKDDGGGNYEPTDMVVDMDMSDEDLEEILRDAQNQSSNSDSTTHQQSPPDSQVGAACTRAPLLDTPGEYIPQQTWESSGSMNVPPAYQASPNVNMQQPPPPPPPQDWNSMSWNNGSGGGSSVPPPPRPPFPMPAFQYGGNTINGVPPPSGEYSNNSNMNDGNEYGVSNYASPQHGGRGGGGGGRGRGGWGGGPSPQYRHNFSRPPRGGGMNNGSPYYSRGGRGGGNGPNSGMRGGGYRGKFRGNNNAWA